MVLLLVSSVAGATVRALNPANKDSLTSKATQGVVGVLSAIFLGPLIGGMIEGYVSDPVYAMSASGFICGISGIELTKAITGKMLK